jgi:hypothetical protein
MTTYDRIVDLLHSLEAYDPKSHVEKSVGEIANALLAQAKETVGNDPILGAIKPFEMGNNAVAGHTAAGVRTVMQQVLAALPFEPPA